MKYKMMSTAGLLYCSFLIAMQADKKQNTPQVPAWNNAATISTKLSPENLVNFALATSLVNFLKNDASTLKQESVSDDSKKRAKEYNKSIYSKGWFWEKPFSLWFSKQSVYDVLEENKGGIPFLYSYLLDTVSDLAEEIDHADKLVLEKTKPIFQNQLTRLCENEVKNSGNVWEILFKKPTQEVAIKVDLKEFIREQHKKSQNITYYIDNIFTNENIFILTQIPNYDKKNLAKKAIQLLSKALGKPDPFANFFNKHKKFLLSSLITAAGALGNFYLKNKTGKNILQFCLTKKIS